MRHVSRIVTPVICVVGTLALFTVLYVTVAQSAVFPDRVHRYMWTITAHSSGDSKAAAIADLLLPQQRASDFLEANGFPASAIAISAPSTYDDGVSSAVRWSASQDISVPADTYAKFARLSNRLEIYQQRRTDLKWLFPEPPFARFAKVVGFLTILLLCFSVVSLETRSADANRAPRGMHPISVAIQTMACGLLILISLVEAHVLALLGPRVLILILAIGLISIAAWLLKTRVWWTDQSFLRYAFFLYVATFIAIIVYGVYALTVPVT
jgi:hypothetical protein